ncbi:MAG: HU family DNA-binding protein [Rhodobacteraceae bacterium]|nr:HU family DNA-binding protein [Paracoccaceae bacterium]
MTKKAMTKAQLISALSEEMGTDKNAAKGALEALEKIVTTELQDGGAVTLPGLGKFVCRDRPERMVRNPATGEQMKKGADRVAKVTIAKALKDLINS